MGCPSFWSEKRHFSSTNILIFHYKPKRTLSLSGRDISIDINEITIEFLIKYPSKFSLKYEITACRGNYSWIAGGFPELNKPFQLPRLKLEEPLLHTSKNECPNFTKDKKTYEKVVIFKK